MWRNQGNISDRPKRKRKPSLEQSALYIAESIWAKQEAGVQWDWFDYGIEEKPSMIKMVNQYLEEFAYYGDK